MNTTLKVKIGLLIGLIIFSIVAVIPSFYDKEDKRIPDWWRTYLAPKGINPGLDLQGGLHLVLRVDQEKAVTDSLALTGNDLVDGLAEQNITAIKMESQDKYRVMYTLPNLGAVDTVRNLVTDDFTNLDITVEAEEGSFPRVTLELKPDAIDFIRDNAINQSLEIIRNRIDQFGVAEPVIIRQGVNEIVVQLPGVKDPEQAIDLIKTTAQLEFKMVADGSGINLRQLVDEVEKSGIWQEEDPLDQLNLALQGRLPEGTEIHFEKTVDQRTQQEIKIPILLKRTVLMTGDMIKDARVRFDSTFNQPVVSMDMTGRGTKVFGNITEKNVGKRLAIVLDDVVCSAPVIQDKILGGSAQISGSFTHPEASNLAIALRVGALPAPIEIIQKMVVGASLGHDSIDKGLKSGLIGAMLVLLFMVVYYRLSGVIADFALTLNILFLFVGLAMFSATLTLPGIAGIILSIGMAVDANVLIFERMREEFALGKSAKSGVDGGFDKAFWSIIDSQVTTLITALALFMFGTGPIKGFAVTLSLGIIFNLFAVLFCSRLIYEGLYTTRKLKDLRFMRLFSKTSFDFIKLKNKTFAFSAIMVIFGLVAFAEVLTGHANLGVDFTGGSMLQYASDKPYQLDQVRAAFKKNGWDLSPQQIEGENRFIIKIKEERETVGELDKQLTAVLQQELPEQNFVLESQSEIGSSISAMLRNKAIQAIAISLLGVICYLALRFDLSFGLAAAAATFHDVLVVLGICWLLDVEITLLIVTALLTLAGYSLNDSVVVFDRIRENMQKTPDKTFADIINNSINQILSRSAITSLTTGLVLVSLVFFGGAAIHDFSLALLTGVIVGTYSSVFVASPLLTLKARKEFE